MTRAIRPLISIGLGKREDRTAAFSPSLYNGYIIRHTSVHVVQLGTKIDDLCSTAILCEYNEEKFRQIYTAVGNLII